MGVGWLWAGLGCMICDSRHFSFRRDVVMKNLTRCMTVIAAAGSFALVGCSKEESGTAATEGNASTVVKVGFNSVCPFTGEDVDSTTTVEFGGKTVGLCCADCLEKWNGLTDEERRGTIDGLIAKGDEMAEEAGDKAKEGLEKLGGGDGG